MKLMLIGLLVILGIFAEIEGKVEFKLERRSFVEKQNGIVDKRKGVFKKSRRHNRAKMSMGQPMTNYYDDFYIMQIQIGTPPQSFWVRPDTSKSDLWVFDKAHCTTKLCKGGLQDFNRTLFDSSASSTFMPSSSGTNFTVSQYYGPLCNSGILANDKFTLPSFPAVSQGFGLCYDAGYFMGFHPYDGILGLSWPGLSTYGLKPADQTEMDASNFDKPIFSVWINGIMGNKNNFINSNGGQITWGGLDTTNCNPSITYVPVSSKTYWQFSLSSLTVGSYSLNQPQQAIVSTGFTEMGMPSNIAQMWLPLINGTYNANQTNYYAPCDANSVKNYPSITFGIGGQQFAIPPTEWLSDENKGMCRVRVFNTDNFGPKFVLSTIFIRNYCVHFDVGQSRLGFSTSIHTNT